ncbi:hypothetical protein QP735_03935 [Curtobacterium citreum]|uniref:hypothetical protein n=1 Tax=Curtobacterium citreum TaxID=2036 RepID=UPI00254C0B8E|nr:hypothetical protein [Curtobacterium citreum]MDK8171672.1 hypothetical protein [Curtobacterium citreum]
MLILQLLVPVVLVVVAVLIFLAARGSMGRSPLQDQQDAEWRAMRDERRRARAERRSSDR